MRNRYRYGGNALVWYRSVPLAQPNGHIVIEGDGSDREMRNALSGFQVVGRTSVRRSNTMALLLDLEELLTEQLSLVGEAAFRRRLEIEAELADVRRQLARLGFTPSKIS